MRRPDSAGFIITGRPDYLSPYQSATAALPDRLAKLQRLTAGDPEQARRFGELEGLIRAKLDELRLTIELGQHGETDQARDEILNDRGKAAMELIRRLVGEVIVAESALGTERVRAVDEAQSNTLYAAMAGSVLGLGGLLVGTVSLLRRNRRLREAEAELSAQSALLQATLDNCRDGIAAFDGGDMLVAFNRHFFDLMDFPPALARRGQALASFQEIERQRPCQALGDRGATDNSSADAHQLLKIGSRDLELSRNPMPGGGFVVSSLDITRRLQAEGDRAPGAEDGGDRPAHRRRRARLQQPAAGDHRQPRAAGARTAGGDARAQRAG